MGYYKFSKFDLLTLIVIFYVVHSENDAQILNDHLSLLSFMSGITDDPERAFLSWNASDVHVCKWAGVGCDVKNNRVVELNLSHKSLRGTIAPALFNLSRLAILDLSGNFLTGKIPPEIGSLYELEELSLSSNLLEGNIPTEVGFLKQLMYLNLGSNKLYEYGMGKHASPEGDVYSFGVLLLEIITMKRPTDILFHEGSSMHEWIKSCYPNKLEPIVEQVIVKRVPPAMFSYDREIWRDVILELVELGLICTQHNPAMRPTMLDAAHEVSILKQYICSSSSLHIEETTSIN